MSPLQDKVKNSHSTRTMKTLTSQPICLDLRLISNKTPNNDELVKTQKTPVIAIPVRTGIQEDQSSRGSDDLGDLLRDH